MPAVKSSTVAKAITRAKKILETDGWVVGAFRCDEGKHCAVGALRAAVLGSPYLADSGGWTPTYRAAIEALATATSGRQEVKRAIADATEEAARWDYNLLDEVSDRLEALVIDFNDTRVENAAGRKAVLARFDKAAAAVTA